MKRLWILAAGLLMLGLLSGCSSIQPREAKASAATAFMESAKIEGTNITLRIDPVKVGENRMVVLVDDAAINVAEAQVIMATMGHGVFVDLSQTGPGRFEAVSSAIDMEGRWMVRVEATPGSGETKTATFHLVVK